MIENSVKFLLGNIKSKPTMAQIWKLIPMNICWQIWLERNKSVFENKKIDYSREANKASVMISEALASKGVYLPNHEALSWSKFQWCQVFVKTSSLQSKQNNSSSDWEIRKEHSQFLQWWRSQDSHTIFFDGASKGNPGEASASGIIFDPEGNKDTSFSWGLGKKTNNEAEWLALLHSLEIVASLNVGIPKVFGDSRHVIKRMRSRIKTKGSNNHRIQRRINLLTLPQDILYFHILHGNNSAADEDANKGATLAIGKILYNNEKSRVFFYPLTSPPCFPPLTLAFRDSPWTAPLPHSC